MDAWWVLVVVAYLLGTFPTAVLVGRRLGHDPTAEGSGNPGASNTYRTMGRGAGAAVLLGDLGKGVLAASPALLGRPTLGVVCGAAAVLGHVAPLGRRAGGKGVATFAGVGSVVLPVATLVLAGAWGLIAWRTGLASLGSVALVVGVPVGALVAGRPMVEVAVLAACAVLVLARHRDNLHRLARGEEASVRAPIA